MFWADPNDDADQPPISNDCPCVAIQRESEISDLSKFKLSSVPPVPALV